MMHADDHYLQELLLFQLFEREDTPHMMFVLSQHFHYLGPQNSYLVQSIHSYTPKTLYRLSNQLNANTFMDRIV